jgi:prephenate dehydrogenase
VREVGIIGLGLMGGSAGMALRGLGGQVRVSGLCRTDDGARMAERLGAVDHAGTSVESLRDCELVLIATPLAEFETMIDLIGRTFSREVLITDVASVKRPVVEMARRSLPFPQRFLGGHPMAGKAQTGISHADPGLFRDTPWVFTPLPEQDITRFAWWTELVGRIGARPLFMDPVEHDRQAAFVSHLAFTLSAAYRKTVRNNGGEQMAGPGYGSMTRLATGDPAMYGEIAAANRAPLLAAIDAFSESLTHYRRRIATEDRLAELFSEVSRASS